MSRAASSELAGVSGVHGIGVAMARHNMKGDDRSLRSRFEALRARRPPAALAAWLDRPLSLWVSTQDRNVPLALIDRSIRDLLAMSYDELAATPGIGHKKIAALILLLGRIR